MKRGLAVGAMVLGLVFAAHFADAQTMPEEKREGPPTLTVTGQGDTSARPDRAVLQLGAVAQAEEASAAQEQVNSVMQEAIAAIREVGIRDDMITTTGLSLHPVYSAHQPPRPLPGQAQQPPTEPRIVGYRASNRVRVTIDDLSKIGDVIDAGVKSGANHVEDLSFQLKDDTAAQREALQAAARQARAKADAIAEAMNLKIDSVMDVAEGGVHIIRPRMELARAGVAAMDAATPVQPGQVDVQAVVTVTYRVSPAEGAER